jgi:hypothetical protein
MRAMGSVDNKDEREGRFCDRSDENYEKAETGSAAPRACILDRE